MGANCPLEQLMNGPLLFFKQRLPFLLEGGTDAVSVLRNQGVEVKLVPPGRSFPVGETLLAKLRVNARRFVAEVPWQYQADVDPSLGYELNRLT